MVLAVDPLSPSAIATLLDTLDVSPNTVFLELSSTHSLLTIQGGVDQPIWPFHKSFSDFIVDPSRCIDERFRIYPPIHHLVLLAGCHKPMNRTLEKNMRKLSDTVLNSEVDDLEERIERYISPALRYACKFWHKHLVGEHAKDDAAIAAALHCFLEKKFVFWLDVLSVLGAAGEPIDALQVAVNWLVVC